MRAQVKFEWRQLQEPEGYQDPAYVIMNALQAAGYSVANMPDVQGVWDEDKQKYDPWFPLVRIAESLEEILRLVKKDQEDAATLQRARDNEKD